MLDGKAYWTEQACYAFTSGRNRPARGGDRNAARALPQGGRARGRQQAVGAHAHPAGLGRLHRARYGGAPTRRSVGRFDLAYDGKGPPKLLEYNADTPTALYEAAVVQWHWLKDVKPDADQFNSIHERLIEAWRGILRRLPAEALVHFARFEDQPEDLATSEYMRDTALQAGLAGKPLAVPQIGWNGKRFTDPDEMPIRVMAKLYPWEWMAREEFGAHVLTDTTAFIEPAVEDDPSATRCCCRCCGRAFPATTNLLPAFDTQHADLGRAHVKKPIFGREGHNVTLVGPGLFDTAAGSYGGEGYVWQAYQPLPVFDGNHAVVGLLGDRGQGGRRGHARGRAAHHPQQQPLRAALFRTGEAAP